MKVPTKQTLRKFGLSREEWIELFNLHDGGCHICKKKQSPEAKRSFHTDHEHIKNWKSLPPEERKKYVRGILCFRCNKFRMLTDTTIKVTKAMVVYLERYELARSKSDN